jgi:hypothetical protein
MNERAIFRKGLTVRAEAETDEKMTIRGYPILFDEITDRAGYFKEKIDRNALAETDLSEVKLLVGHDFRNLLGQNGINMRIQIDDTGLWFECDLPKTTFAKDTYELVKAELLTGMSFGFYADKFEVDYETNIETILRISNLLEITLTPIPAYPQTVATAVERIAQHEKELKNNELEKEIKELEDM